MVTQHFQVQLMFMQLVNYNYPTVSSLRTVWSSNAIGPLFFDRHLTDIKAVNKCSTIVVVQQQTMVIQHLQEDDIFTQVMEYQCSTAMSSP